MVILDKPLYICIKEGVVILTLANLSLAEFGDEHKISGRDWIKYSISVWDDKKSNEERSLAHPALFPVSLVSKLIKIYTRCNEVILDPFAGIGSTLVSAALLNRRSIGFELSAEFSSIAQERLKNFTVFNRLINESSFKMSEFIPKNSIDFCITSPPYWDILNRKRTADYKDIKNYGDSEEDLGNIGDYNEFLGKLEFVLKQVFDCLKENRHCVLIVMDIRKKSKFYPFHIDVTEIMQSIGFELEDYIIWDRRQEYNNLRPLGYPTVFRVNKVHEYICIFKKPKVIQC